MQPWTNAPLQNSKHYILKNYNMVIALRSTVAAFQKGENKLKPANEVLIFVDEELINKSK